MESIDPYRRLAARHVSQVILAQALKDFVQSTLHLLMFIIHLCLQPLLIAPRS